MSNDIRLNSKKRYLPKSAAKVQKYFDMCKFLGAKIEVFCYF